MRSVSFSDGGLRDRDIIFRDEKDLVFCFLGCVVKFPTRLTAITAGGERRSRILAIECVSFFPFSPSSRFSFFSRSNALTHTNKEGAKTRGKAERRDREQFASLDFWITD